MTALHVVDGSIGLADDDVEARLARVAAEVRRAIDDAIPDGEPHRWLYRLVREYPRRDGKGLRPSLCLAACCAFGGHDHEVFPIAVAIEMLHNAFLIHDDVADASEQRRGQATLPMSDGDGLALNAGDALVLFANRLLRRHLATMDRAIAARLHHEFDTMATRTLEGQAIELGWRRDHVVDLQPEDYLELIMRKTCWYTTIHPLRVGTLVGSRGRADLRPMFRFGFLLGAAFQIRDDLLNLVGDEHVYGKEIDGDLFEGKRTLMLIHLLRASGGADRREVVDYVRMARTDRGVDVVARIRDLMTTYGSIEFASEYGRGIASAALDAFDEAFSGVEPGSDTAFVQRLVPYVLGRRR